MLLSRNNLGIIIADPHDHPRSQRKSGKYMQAPAADLPLSDGNKTAAFSTRTTHHPRKQRGGQSHQKLLQRQLARTSITLPETD